MRTTFSFVRERPDVSVLIVGGGINGIGLLRELALQGIDVLLVEKSDFCAGTSSAMTRVIHGGLRYLENAEFRLVREALHERNLLLKNAPHCVRPLPTTIPIFTWTSGIWPSIRNFLRWPTKPGNRGALLIKAGLTMYDIFAGQSPMPKHRFQFKREVRKYRPALNPDVICTATYYDAKITYPERLCLELVEDAEAAYPGAHAMNYVRLESARGNTVVLRDEVTGETCEVRPRIVVNAAGPWIDGANHNLGRESAFIGGTKGSHIVLDHRALAEAMGEEMIYFVNRDGRICIFYVVHGRIIAGSTDIPTDDPDAVCDEAEVDYILEAMRNAFPAIPANRSHVVFRFCGVRPLPRSSALTPGQISRDHSFPVLPAGNGTDFPIYSLVGGKWTSFRALSEQVADEVLRVLGRKRVCSTENLAIGGGKGFPIKLEGTTLPEERISVLLERYGSGAVRVAAYLQAGNDAALVHHPAYSRREIEYIALNERVVHLDDLIMRRTLMGLLGEMTLPLLNELASVVSPVLGWPEQEGEAEVERVVALFKKVHGVNLAA
jgi:glycerol-3-phosphate dehydrogenase